MVDKGKQKELPGMKRSGSADDVHLEQAEQPEKKRKRAADDVDLELELAKNKARRMAIAEKHRIEEMLTRHPDWQKNTRGEWFHVGQ